jgi:hypothetical protein
VIEKAPQCCCFQPSVEPMSRNFGSTNVLTTLDVRQTGAMEQVLLSGFYDRASDQLLKIFLTARVLLSLRGNTNCISIDGRRGALAVCHQSSPVAWPMSSANITIRIALSSTTPVHTTLVPATAPLWQRIIFSRRIANSSNR